MEVNLPVVEALDELGVHVDPGDLVTERREAGGHDEADVPAADDGDAAQSR